MIFDIAVAAALIGPNRFTGFDAHALDQAIHEVEQGADADRNEDSVVAPAGIANRPGLLVPAFGRLQRKRPDVFENGF